MFMVVSMICMFVSESGMWLRMTRTVSHRRLQRGPREEDYLGRELMSK